MELVWHVIVKISNSHILKLLAMKKSTFKQIFVAIIFAALASAMTSCNKGYGCPTNFKVVKATFQLAK